MNIKSRQDNHDKHLFNCFYQSLLSGLDSYLSLPFPKGGLGPLINSAGRLIEVLSAVFFRQ